MKLCFETKQQVASGTCVGAKKFFGILLLQLFFTCASTSLQAQSNNYWTLNGNNINGGQPILGTLLDHQNLQPLRFYANGNQRGIFSQYSGYLGVGINAPKNPLHIHSNDMRANCTEFGYNDPEDPIIGNDMNGIGTQFPHAELSVNGTVLAKAVRVTTNATYWPDYVFGSDYKLMTLSELESYVNENKHLPGIPSASEVEEAGSVDLGEMNTLLLQKVEELTRYIIDLQKQIDELKKGKGVKE